MIRPDHLGDLLFATPALKMLRRALPAAEITLMVGPWAEPVAQHIPDVDRLLFCPFPGFTKQPKGSPFAPYRLLMNQARLVRRLNFDLAINLRFDFWWGALLGYCARIPRRVGYDRPEGALFLSHAVPYVEKRHEVRQNLTLVEIALADLGFRAFEIASGLEGRPGPASQGRPNTGAQWLKDNEGNGYPPLQFSTSLQDDLLAARWLADQQVQTPFCVIHPGAGAAVKLWNAESFATVADTLFEQFGLNVVLTGGLSEAGLVAEITAKMRHSPARLVGGELGLVAAVLRQSGLAIGLDSGIMHLAVTQGIPSVHLYGPVDDRAFGPWGDRRQHVVVKSDYWCIPCNRLDYASGDLVHHPCVQLITAEQVLGAAKQILTAGQAI